MRLTETTALLRCGAALGLLVALPGCSVNGLTLRQDDRVEITSPADDAVVREPVEVTWTVEGFEVTGPTEAASPESGYFGVLLDRFPPPPGQTLSWLVEGDESCKRNPRCPNREYFEDRGIFTTTDTSFTLPVLPGLHDSQHAEIHHVNIVLLDGAGRRIGESMWTVDFEIEREDV
ncbi:MAG: hypothetical protein LC808_03175 [Actinobacteria bacterium]|nr:hypothetical protein [Actinomycetota bacterium]